MAESDTANFEPNPEPKNEVESEIPATEEGDQMQTTNISSEYAEGASQEAINTIQEEKNDIPPTIDNNKNDEDEPVAIEEV